MSARDFVSKNQPIIAVICVLGLAFAIWRILSSSGTGHHPPNAMWIYNLDQGTISALPRETFPPIEMDGGVGYQAVLFSCTKCSDKSSREVAYLSRYADDVKAIFERGMTEADIGTVSRVDAELIASVEQAKEGNWVAATPGNRDRLMAEATAICDGEVDYCSP